MKITETRAFSAPVVFDGANAIERALEHYVAHGYAEGELERIREHSERVLAVLISVIKNMPTTAQRNVFNELNMVFEP